MTSIDTQMMGRKCELGLYQTGVENIGLGEHQWNPVSRNRQSQRALCSRGDFDGGHYYASLVRRSTSTESGGTGADAIIRVMENQEFTLAYSDERKEARTQVTVILNEGERLTGESGGYADDVSAPKSVAKVEAKFRSLSEDLLGAKRCNAIVDRLELWKNYPL